MPGKTILIAGAGFGGLSAASELRRRLGSEHRIIVVDRSDVFYPGFVYLWVMTGERPKARANARNLRNLQKRGIEYLNEEIVAIEPATRTIRTNSGDISGDFLIVALGADLAPEAVEGFAEGAFNLYSADGAEALHLALPAVESGTVAVLITRTPFKCPPAPYEAAFLIDSVLRERGIRDRVAVKVFSPEPFPMPTGGPTAGQRITEMLAERGIEYFPRSVVKRVDASSRTIEFEGRNEAFDLLVGIPPHTVPKVVKEAGITDDSGWIAIDQFTMTTKFERVFAIGDCTIVPLGEGRFLPKAGVLAAAQGKVVAENIAAELGGRTPSAQFDGKGFCWVEVGSGLAALGEADFYATPAPQVILRPPSPDYRREKEEYERRILDEWLS